MFCESENGGKCMYLFLCFVLRKQPSYVNPTQGVINEAPEQLVETNTEIKGERLFDLYSPGYNKHNSK